MKRTKEFHHHSNGDPNVNKKRVNEDTGGSKEMALFVFGEFSVQNGFFSFQS